MEAKTELPQSGVAAGIHAHDVAITSMTVLTAAAVLVAPLPVAILGALAFIACATRVPAVALGLVVISIPFQPLSRSVGRFEFATTEVLLLPCCAAALARVGVYWFARRQDRFTDAVRSALARHAGDPVILMLLILFVLAAAASLAASATIHPSVQSLRVIVVEPVAFYLLVVGQLRGRRDAAWLALALLIGAVLVSVFGLWQYATGDRIITAEAGLRRIRGFYGSPNNLGLFLGRSILMGLALALWWERGRAALLAATATMGVALVLTFSVGAWVAVGLSVLLVAALRNRRTFRAAVGLGAGASVVAVIAALSVPRLGSHFDLQSGTSSIRLDVWQSALRMLADHSLRGIGLDNFLYYYQHGYRLPSAWPEPNLSHPHNLVLDFWLSLGLPGPVILGGLLGRIVEVVHRAWTTADNVERGLYAGALGALADTVFHGFVDNSYFLPDLAVLFWLIFAIVCLLSMSRKAV